MTFLENVRKEVTVSDGKKDKYLTFKLQPIPGDRWDGNPLLGIDAKYRYSLEIEEHNDPNEQKSYNLYHELLNASKRKTLVSGHVYISADDVQEFKKDPYKFCVDNNILEVEKEVSNESDMAGSDISEGES